jgi:hypothetical protein
LIKMPPFHFLIENRMILDKKGEKIKLYKSK